MAKSLTPLEKAFVKRQIKNNEIYLAQLLEDLYILEVYDNKSFIKSYKNRKYHKNLTQNKNYLKHKIVDSLMLYSHKHSAEIERRYKLYTITVFNR